MGRKESNQTNQPRQEYDIIILACTSLLPIFNQINWQDSSH